MSVQLVRVISLGVFSLFAMTSGANAMEASGGSLMDTARSDTWSFIDIPFGEFCSTASIAVDSQGDLGMAYIHKPSPDTHDLYYAVYDGFAWTCEKVAEDAYLPTLTFGSDDMPVIAVSQDYNSVMVFRKNPDQTWSGVKMYTCSQTGCEISLVLDSDDDAHVVFSDIYDEIVYSYWDGFSYNVCSFFGSHADLTLDSQDNPLIAYRGLRGNLFIKYMQNDLWWTSIVRSRDFYSDVSLKMRENGLFEIYWTVNDLVGQSIGFGPQWQSEIVAAVESEFIDNFDSEISSFSSSYIAVSTSSSSDLWFLSNTGSGWESVLLDSCGMTGLYPSIALDSLGGCYIAYEEWWNPECQLKLLWYGDPLSGAGYESESADEMLSVSPNPSCGSLSISYAATSDDSAVIIYDGSGRQLYSFTHLTSGNGFLQITDLPTGIYLAQLQSEQGIASAKFVVIH